MTGQLAAEKKALRARIAALRDAAAQRPGTQAAAQTACAAISRVLSAHFAADELGRVTLAAYMPMRNELDPMPAMFAHPGPVCVPVIRGRDQPLEFHRWHPDADMVEGPFKALVPRRRDPLQPQALIVPLLAFDARGYRLGYGGGFYDRTLEVLRAQGPVLTVGLAFDAQEVARVPTEASDQPLDVIITPTRQVIPV